jgi:transcriptional regulator with XRE-family HTH domain
LTRGAVVDDWTAKIRLANESQIISLPASQKQVRGLGRGVLLVVLDVAGFQSSELWTAAHYLALDERARGSRIVMCGTPWGGMEHFFRRAFVDGQDDADPDHASFHWTYKDNPSLDYAYLERQRERVSPFEYAAEVARSMAHHGPMPAASDPSELGAFLKGRRAQLTPHEVGLPDTDSVRKVKGLRREEVAGLAAISVDYYTRLEQGRVQASASVRVTLARALRLDEDQQTYLYTVAGKTDAKPRRRGGVERVRPAMRRLLDQLTHTPAVVFGKRMDILHWNHPAAALYTDFAQIPAARRNYVRLLFSDPAIRAMHLDWDHDARDAVAVLRMEAATASDDPDLAQLVGELSVQDADFRTWWAARYVNSATYGTKRYRHPVVGSLTLDCDTWASPDGSGQRLMVLTAEPGTPSEDALRILTSWTASESSATPTTSMGNK